LELSKKLWINDLSPLVRQKAAFAIPLCILLLLEFSAAISPLLIGPEETRFRACTRLVIFLSVISLGVLFVISGISPRPEAFGAVPGAFLAP